MTNPLIDRFKSEYAEFGPKLLDSLPELYSRDIEFIDPVHRLSGVEALSQYFAASMAGLEFCSFDFLSSINGEKESVFEWEMRYAHRKIKRGEQVLVHGVTVIRYRDLIFYHRDYYDLAEMMFDQLPFVGNISRLVKSKMAGN